MSNLNDCMHAQRALRTYKQLKLNCGAPIGFYELNLILINIYQSRACDGHNLHIKINVIPITKETF